MMRRMVIAAAAAATMLSTPALARDGSMYMGLDVGVVKPGTTDLRFGNSTVTDPDGLRLKHKLGLDADFVTGYDFGMFRLEGEFGYKRSSIKRVTVGTGAGGAVGTLPGRYDADGSSRVTSLMANALFDFDTGSAMGGSIGLGVGTASVRYRAGAPGTGPLNFAGQDNALAWQALAELRTAVSEQIDVGIKYRYFRTGKLDFGPFCQTTCGGLDPFRMRGHYSSNSLLVGLTYNMGARAVALPPPPPPPPPMVEAPATQTCPDGSVILATSACPVPPPPPPPPVERGERGR